MSTPFPSASIVSVTTCDKMPVATEVASQWPGKEQVVNDVPKVIKELQFGVLYDFQLEVYIGCGSNDGTDQIKT